MCVMFINVRIKLIFLQIYVQMRRKWSRQLLAAIISNSRNFLSIYTFFLLLNLVVFCLCVFCLNHKLCNLHEHHSIHT